MDPSRMEKQELALPPRRRKSNRRSSILKSPTRNHALGELDPNVQDDTRQSRVFQSRRVSFADTYQVKEFSRHDVFETDNQAKRDVGVELNNDPDPGSSHVSGLDKLLTGTLCTQRFEDTHEVKELPFPKDPDGSSLLSQESQPEETMEVVDVFVHVPPRSLSVATPHSTQSDAIISGPDDVPPKKIDTFAFLRALKDRPKQVSKITPKHPRGESFSNTVYVPEQNFSGTVYKHSIYSSSNEDDVSTVLNTSLNRYLPSIVPGKGPVQAGSALQKTEQPSATGGQDLMCHESLSVENRPRLNLTVSDISNQFPSKLSRKMSTEKVISEDNISGFNTALETQVKTSETALSAPALSNLDCTKPPVVSAEFRKVSAESRQVFTGKKYQPVEDKENMCVNDSRFSTMHAVGGGLKNLETHTEMEIAKWNGVTQADGPVSAYANQLRKSGDDTNHMMKSTDVIQRFSGLESNAGMEMTTCHGNIFVDNIGSTTKKIMESTDVTRRFSDLDTDAGMEMTTCHGNIVVDKIGPAANHMMKSTDVIQRFSALKSNAGMVMRTCHGNIFVDNTGSSTKKIMESTDVTRRFSDQDTDAGMEMTTCHGNIVVDKIGPGTNLMMKSTNVTRTFSDLDTDAGMEMTTCHGNIVVDKIGPATNHMMKSTDVTRRFSDLDNDAGLEMTTCHGNIVVDKIGPAANHMMKSTDVIQRFSGLESNAGMEMMTCHGNIFVDNSGSTTKKMMEATDATRRFSDLDTDAGMEMTTCHGNIAVDKIGPDTNLMMKSTDVTRRFTDLDTDGGMEMTTCHGNIVIDKIGPATNHMMKSTDVTRRFTDLDTDGGMEMTTCHGNIAVAKISPATNHMMKPTDVTRRFSDLDTDCGMEMTTCHGNIVVDKMGPNTNLLMKSTDVTRRFSDLDTDGGMEMTTCHGNIAVDKISPATNLLMKSTDVTRRFSDLDTDGGMEMTTCHGNIAVDKIGPATNPMMKPTDVTQRFSDLDTDAGMEMTTCHGNIVVDKMGPNTNLLVKSTDVTRRFSDLDTDGGMEMTTCHGNIAVDKIGPATNHIVKPTDVTRRFSDLDKDAGMEMTTCHGNIAVDKIGPATNHMMKPTDVTRRFSDLDKDAGMEMTTCHGNIVIDKISPATNHMMKPTDVTRRFSDLDTDAGMEMTTCHGNIAVDKIGPATNHMVKPTDVTRRFSDLDKDAGMEMTTCHGNIVIDKISPATNHMMKPTDATRRFSDLDTDGGMEMTTCHGNIVVDKIGLATNHMMKPTDVTRRFSELHDAGMEMTTCHGNIVVDKTDTNYRMKATDVTQRFSGLESDAGMEMTTCHGNIVLDNKAQAGDKNHGIKSNEFTGRMRPTDVTQRFSGSEGDAGMDMTTSHGNIVVDKTGPAHMLKSNDFTKAFSQLESNVGMELTTCHSNIVADGTLSEVNVRETMKSDDVTQSDSERGIKAGFGTSPVFKTSGSNFTAVGSVLRKRCLPTTRLSCDPQLYPPEKVQRLLGETKKASNLSYLSKKVKSMTSDQRRSTLALGQLQTAFYKTPSHKRKAEVGVLESVPRQPVLKDWTLEPQQYTTGQEDHVRAPALLGATEEAKSGHIDGRGQKVDVARDELSGNEGLKRSGDGIPVAKPTGVVQPKLPAVVQPELPVVVQPELPTVVQPELPAVVQPELPAMTQPELPVVVQPELPTVVKPELPAVVQPELPAVVQPELPAVVQPELPFVAQPKLPAMVQSELPAVVQPELPFVAQPKLSAMVQSELPAVVKPELPEVSSAMVVHVDSEANNGRLVLEKGGDLASALVTDTSQISSRPSESESAGDLTEISLLDINFTQYSPEAKDKPDVTDVILFDINFTPESPEAKTQTGTTVTELSSVNVLAAKKSLQGDLMERDEFPGKPSDAACTEMDFDKIHANDNDLREEPSKLYVEPSQPCGDTPVEASQPCGDTPVEAAQPCGDIPVEASQAYRDTPVEASQAYRDTPVEASHVYRETRVEASQAYRDTPVEASQAYRDTPVEASQAYRDTPVEASQAYGEALVDSEVAKFGDVFMAPDQTLKNSTLEGYLDSQSERTLFISKSRASKSVIDLSMSQSDITNRTNVSLLPRSENTSYQNKSSFSILVEPYPSQAPCTAEQFLQLVTITSIDWSAPTRRSSFAPFQRRAEDLSVSEILDQVLINKAEEATVDTAIEEMEKQKTEIIQMTSDLEKEIEEDPPEIFQQITESKEQCEAIKRQATACWSACRKNSKLKSKGNKLRWLRAENDTLKDNKTRLTDAVQELENFSDSLTAQLQAITLEIEQAEKEECRVNQELTALAENEMIQNLEAVKLEKEVNELQRQEKEAGEAVQKLQNQFLAHKRLIEWTVDDMTQQTASFLFLYDYIRVMIEYWLERSVDLTDRLIDQITVQSGLPEDASDEHVFAHNMVAGALPPEVLDTYESERDLPRLLEEISQAVWTAKSLERDLKRAQYTHRSHVSGTSVSMYFRNVTKCQKCCVRFDFIPSLHRLSPATLHIQTLSGDVPEGRILEAVKGLPTDNHYLQHMVDAIDKVVMEGDIDTLWLPSR